MLERLIFYGESATFLMLRFFSFRRRDVRQHRETMKQLIAILSSLILTSVLYAHEGHDHGEGVGSIITTATVTGSEGHEYVTAPGWGVPENGKNIGSLHGDLAVDQFGNVYAATNGEPGIAVFDCFGNFTKSLKGFE